MVPMEMFSKLGWLMSEAQHFPIYVHSQATAEGGLTAELCFLNIDWVIYLEASRRVCGQNRIDNTEGAKIRPDFDSAGQKSSYIDFFLCSTKSVNFENISCIDTRGVRRTRSVRPASPGRDWFPGLNPKKPGSRAGPGHIIYFPGPGLKFCWPGVGREPGRFGYIARHLENHGYHGCSAYLNHISRNMQHLPIKFPKAIYLWRIN